MHFVEGESQRAREFGVSFAVPPFFRTLSAPNYLGAQLRTLTAATVRKHKSTLRMDVSSSSYYGEYHGHLVEHLSTVHAALGIAPRVWLVGDSSLDNKYYVAGEKHEAPTGYKDVLKPPLCRADVCYWLHKLLTPKFAVINAAVEESTLSQRDGNSLLVQDKFVRDHISNRDILVCSIGGNDIALRPSVATVLAAGRAIVGGDVQGAMPHFQQIFQHDTSLYIEKLVAKTKPRLVIVCMLYFPDEDNSVTSWASSSLRMLKYDSNPALLQQLMQTVYNSATQKVRVDGVPIVPCALYEAMDGKNGALYAARVEPSEDGGFALAKLLRTKIEGALMP